MWENSLKNVESDNNKILYETLFDFFLQRNGTYCLNKPRIIILNDCNCLTIYNNLCALVGQIKDLILSTCTVQLRIILVIFSFITFLLLFTTLVKKQCCCNMDQSCTFIHYELSDVHNFTPFDHTSVFYI